MTVDELRNALNEHPLRGDYEVALYDQTADLVTKLWSDSLEWDSAGKRLFINHD